MKISLLLRHIKDFCHDNLKYFFINKKLIFIDLYIHLSIYKIFIFIKIYWSFINILILLIKMKE